MRECVPQAVDIRRNGCYRLIHRNIPCLSEGLSARTTLLSRPSLPRDLRRRDASRPWDLWASMVILAGVSPRLVELMRGKHMRYWMAVGVTALAIGLAGSGCCMAAGAVAVGEPAEIAKDGVA